MNTVEFINTRKINKFLVQCHRIAPSLTAFQIAMLFVMNEREVPVTLQDLSKELGVKPAMVNRYLKPLFDRSGREMVIMEGWDCLYLSDRGKRYCRSLVTNARHFFKG